MDKSKIQKLLQDGKGVYHTQDLAVIWSINNQNTLYTTIKRYVQKGFLNKIHKGFYSTIPLKDINPFYLGLLAIHRYGYVSTESILVSEGLIFQDIKYTTLVSSVSRRFDIAGYSFLVRQMKDDFLYNDIGIAIKNGIPVASVERAIADITYFNPKYHFDCNKKINWSEVDKIKKKIGYV
jgi:predicted transcriptional regulator of viral defense system